MKTPIEIDEEWAEKLGNILRTPSSVDAMDDSAVSAATKECVRRIQRLRMGGRSTPLYALAILLWRAHDRWPRIQFNVEERLALAFRVSLDPSFVQPEWGVVLTGVLVARYANRLAVEAGAKDDVLGQSRKNLAYLRECSVAPTAVQNAATSLLKCWSEDFREEGVDPVIRSCLTSWPDTSNVRDFPRAELDEIISKMNEKLPGDLTEDERRYYRLHLEREEIWSMLDAVSLR